MAVVEAAFVTPVFFILILGIIEGGLFMNDYLAVSSATRAGARSASANGAIAKADLYTLLDVVQESGALGLDQFQYVVVYKADGFGAAPTATCAGGASVQNVCNVYYAADIYKAGIQVAEEAAQAKAEALGQTRTLAQSKIWYGCLTTGPNANNSPDRFWCPSGRVDTRTGNNQAGPDYVGVYMKAKHTWVTKMFGTESMITDQSVIQIEPRAE